MPGSLEVIAGCVFSGKTEELFKRLRCAEISKKNTALFYPFQPIIMHDQIKVENHDGKAWDGARPIARDKPFGIVKKLLDIGKNNIDVVGIDNAHLFPGELVTAVRFMLGFGLRIIVSGLDTDFKGDPFGSMPILMALANEVIKLRAICTECHQEGTRSQRLVDGKPASFGDPILVNQDSHIVYEARCLKHHEVANRPQCFKT